jgi:hypothetical protein
VPDRFPRVRRIALAIKSEDFSRRIAPAPDVRAALGGEPPDLAATAGEGIPIAEMDEAASTELPMS